MYVTPKISQGEAHDILSKKIRPLPLRIRKRPVSLKRIEVTYVPYYVFEIRTAGKEGTQRAAIAVDGLTGTAMLFAEDDLTFETEGDTVSCNAVLSRIEAERIATEEYRRLLMEQGLRNKRMPSAGKMTGGRIIFYPFWIGYVKKGQSYDFMAIDAVSGEPQGVRMRKVLLKAFRQMNVS